MSLLLMFCSIDYWTFEHWYWFLCMPITSFACVCSLTFDVCNLLTCVPYPVTNREFCLCVGSVAAGGSRAINPNHLHLAVVWGTIGILGVGQLNKSISIYLESVSGVWRQHWPWAVLAALGGFLWRQQTASRGSGLFCVHISGSYWLLGWRTDSAYPSHNRK